MQNCKGKDAPVVKGDKFNLNQSHKNDLEREFMNTVPFSGAVMSLMYEQVCTKPDIAFTIGVFG